MTVAPVQKLPYGDPRRLTDREESIRNAVKMINLGNGDRGATTPMIAKRTGEPEAVCFALLQSMKNRSPHVDIFGQLGGEVLGGYPPGVEPPPDRPWCWWVD